MVLWPGVAVQLDKPSTHTTALKDVGAAEPLASASPVEVESSTQGTTDAFHEGGPPAHVGEKQVTASDGPPPEGSTARAHGFGLEVDPGAMDALAETVAAARADPLKTNAEGKVEAEPEEELTPVEAAKKQLEDIKMHRPDNYMPEKRRILVRLQSLFFKLFHPLRKVGNKLGVDVSPHLNQAMADAQASDDYDRALAAAKEQLKDARKAEAEALAEAKAAQTSAAPG